MPTRRLQICVDNAWKDSLTFTYTSVMNPSTGNLIAETPVCTSEEVEKVVTSCRAAFPGWGSKPVAVRTKIISKFRDLLNLHFEELSVLLATEMGKNQDEARGDILKVIEACELAVGTPLELQGCSLMEATRNHDICSYGEPVGVFLGIDLYNFPAMIPFGWFIPSCIVSGNCMVLRATTMVPQTGMRLLELLINAGLPKGVANLVICSRKKLTELRKKPHFLQLAVCRESSPKKGYAKSGGWGCGSLWFAKRSLAPICYKVSATLRECPDRPNCCGRSGATN